MTARAAMIGIGYHFWLRSRWVLLGALAVIVVQVAAVYKLSWPGPRKVVIFAGLYLLGAAAVYLVGVFTISGDMSTPESGYPRHMMVLPLTNRALALTPMLYGLGCLAALWVIVDKLVLTPMGWPASVFQPLLAMLAIVAWLQATSWMPFWFPFARVVVCIASVFTIITLALYAEVIGLGQPVVIGGLLAATGLAVVAAVGGVARARRGDGTMAPWAGRRVGVSVGTSVANRRPFASAERAQIWLELRRNCSLLFGYVLFPSACLLLRPLFARGNPTPLYAFGMMIHPEVLLMTFLLGSPVFFAGLLAANLGKPDAWSKSLTIPSFLAARPMADTMLITAKLKATALTVLIIWAIVLILLAINLLRPYGFSQSESMAHFLVRQATPHRVALAAALICALVVMTWLSAIKGFVFSLYGRPWVVNAAGFGMLGIYLGVGSLGYWAWQHAGWRTDLLHGARLALGIVLTAKIVTAALVVRASRQHRIATDARLLVWTAAWLLGGALVFSTACWLVPAARNSLLVLAAGVALFVPYNRLVAMPLAWHLNRHR
jgi:hypothetical protein